MINYKRITVFTPTYNRDYILPRCYESLIRQSCHDFMWLVVDDGSTDNTEELVASWQSEKKIEIEYIKQSNSGKSLAHNTGVDACQTELFICVDSDDYLTDNAIEKLLKIYDCNTHKDKISGVAALKGHKDGSPNIMNMPRNVLISSLTDLYELHGFRGDTALMYKTEILKRFPFIIIGNECFLGEEYIYRQIDQYYNMQLLNEVIYICEYLSDGYTRNMNNLIFKNPQGYILLKKQAALFSKSIRYKIKHTICYISACFIVREKSIIKNSSNKIISLISYLPGLVLYYLRFKKMEQE